VSGVVGAACCCDTSGQPCIGSSADCAAVAIVVEGFMSYGISSSTDELRREVRICQQSCGPTDPWPASEGESNRTNVSSFAETARSRFKALLVKGAFGGAGNSYSTQNAGSQFRPIATMDFSVSASSAFRTHSEGVACPNQGCTGYESISVLEKTMQGDFGQGGQEEITGIDLVITRDTRFIDCDNVDSCVGEILTPGCYEIYEYQATGTADGIEFVKDNRDYSQGQTSNPITGECTDVIFEDSSSTETQQIAETVALSFTTFSSIDEFNACPPTPPIPVAAMRWNATGLQPPGCNPNDDCPGTCCGDGQGGEMMFAYDGYGGSYFSGSAGGLQSQRWYANLPHCSNVASNDGVESESRSIADSTQINCVGPPSCLNSGQGGEPESPVPDFLFDVFKEGSIEDAIVYGVTVTRKEPLFTMPDPADWPNGV
jgi:hypothetical protein